NLDGLGVVGHDLHQEAGEDAGQAEHVQKEEDGFEDAHAPQATTGCSNSFRRVRTQTQRSAHSTRRPRPPLLISGRRGSAPRLSGFPGPLVDARAPTTAKSGIRPPRRARALWHPVPPPPEK